MIGRLSGKLLEKKPPYLLIDVGGVAYETSASMQTCFKLPAEGSAVVVYTHLVVRDDAHLLYAFHDLQERTLFRALLKVSGVGPKLALAILSSIAPDEFVMCITESDTSRLNQIPGIGKRTAQRLIVEMGDRLTDWQLETLPTTSDAAAMATATTTDNGLSAVRLATREAISALETLGYKTEQARTMVAAVDLGDEIPTSDALIRSALRRRAEGLNA